MSQYENDRNLATRMSLYGYGTNRVPWPEWFLRLVPFNPGAKVLDIGCGNAALWASGHRLLDTDATVVLADQSPGMIQAAKAVLAHIEGNWRFHTASVERLPFDSGSFDIVVANHMLYHATDLGAAVRELARVVKPDGVLFASTNGQAHLGRLRELAIQAGLPQAAERLLGVARIFGLEGGARILRTAFAEVTIHRYNDSLSIPDIQPVLDYVASLQLAEDVGGMERLTAILQRELLKNGSIAVRTDSGVFEARNPFTTVRAT